MLGAIIGDIVGSRYEFSNIKTEDFPLFDDKCRFTDDTVMTIAVFLGILNGKNDPKKTAKAIELSMAEYGNLYINAGYGPRFTKWIEAPVKEPYNSYGNGSAMRVSSIAGCFDDLKHVEQFAEISASVTHNHPEGIKGAKAIAGAAFIARTGGTKDDIKNYIKNNYGYNIDFTLDKIHPAYTFDVSCQGSVPVAIVAALEGKDFEDTIRKAVSVGGDSDTIADMAGAIAEGFYGIPDNIKEKALTYLDERLRDGVKKYDEMLQKKIYDEERFKAACEFAAEKHKGQKRAGGADYITHPLEVARRLKEALYPIEYAIAGVLHDILEDTDATEEDIERLGGKEVLKAVKLLTKTKGYDMQTYMTGIAANDIARMVKSTDRIHNLECSVLRPIDFRLKYMHETENWFMGLDEGSRLDTTIEETYEELEKYNEISLWDI